MRGLICFLVVSLCLIVSGKPDYYWRQFNGEIPLDAVPGSTGAYIAQIVLPNEGIAPGTIYSGRKVAITVADNKRYESSDHVKILCSNNPTQFSWQQIRIGVPINVTKNLVEGGVENGELLYIGRAYHQEKCKIGKVYPNSHSLKIWMDDGGVDRITDFGLLEYTPEEGGTGTEKYQIDMLEDGRSINKIAM